LSRIGMAFRAFFSILGGDLPADVAAHFGYTKASARKTADQAKEGPKPTDGALVLLGILQREARMLDFFLEDIAGFSDDQVGAAVRNIHSQSRDALRKYFRFAPVIDGVEGTNVKVESAGQLARDPAAVKFIGNLPPQGKPAGGVLRHKGWRVDSHSVPSPAPKQNLSILAPAELEVE
jgi:hypothetical protein